jgi:hypothetical protein
MNHVSRTTTENAHKASKERTPRQNKRVPVCKPFEKPAVNEASTINSEVHLYKPAVQYSLKIPPRFCLVFLAK